MKQQYQRLIQRIDALSLRERTITFATAAIAMIFLVNTFLIDPQFARQKNLADQIRQDRAKIAEIQMAIQQKINAHSLDPDADNLLQLQRLKQQFNQTQNGLMDMQKGLISPDKMAGVVEDILQRNDRLRLISLKTLPVTSLSGAAQQESATAGAQVNASPETINAKNVPRAAGAIYQHGIEITVQGSYPDMMRYMAELEAMPWQLFWSKAKLNVDEYPKATLTLNLFTLSLDEKWLNL